VETHDSAADATALPADNTSTDTLSHIDSDAQLVCNPFSQFACLLGDSTKHSLFVDGTHYYASHNLAQTLATPNNAFTLMDFPESDHELLVNLIVNGSVLLIDNGT